MWLPRKRSKHWVEDDDDLEAMYEIFDSTDEITIYGVRVSYLKSSRGKWEETKIRR